MATAQGACPMDRKLVHSIIGPVRIEEDGFARLRPNLQVKITVAIRNHLLHALDLEIQPFPPLLANDGRRKRRRHIFRCAGSPDQRKYGLASIALGHVGKVQQKRCSAGERVVVKLVVAAFVVGGNLHALAIRDGMACNHVRALHELVHGPVELPVQLQLEGRRVPPRLAGHLAFGKVAAADAARVQLRLQFLAVGPIAAVATL
mmetsp:Transcript_10259/g.26500  ORF Transcript_10259/g.26500 Transcript_10259/m.26500 type:complete len:204 (-) Transcript_10259:259-870(-)